MDFDLDLAVSQSNENPVYYAQYAHARISSILRQGEEQGISYDGTTDFSALSTEKEVELLKKLGEFPQAIAEAAEKRMPHRMTNYIFELASTFHSFYNAEKVLDVEKMDRSKARLASCQISSNYVEKCISIDWCFSSGKNVIKKATVSCETVAFYCID